MQSLIKSIQNDPNNWKEKMRQKTKPALPNNLPRGFGRRDIEDRWRQIQKLPRYTQTTALPNLNAPTSATPATTDPMNLLCDEKTLQHSELYKSNIENFIGLVSVPLAVVGPLRLNGMHAQGDYFVPLATTEAALVASYNRGVRALSESGGVSVAVIEEGVSRDPVFVFSTLVEVTEFVHWANKQFDQFRSVAESTTRHGKLKDIKYTLLSNMVHIKFNYTTGDASGQNMVTIATEAVINYIKSNTPIKPKNVYLEGGMSSDKKACQQNLTGCRGKRVIAECIVPKKIVETVFKVTVDQMVDFQTMASASSAQPGIIGTSLHYSNAITAMSIALGQDPACAAESHIGITSGYRTENGDMYCSVMMPNLLVATMGGGTKLPTQRACLDMMGVYGANKANELAEIMAAVCLAGELSLTAAIVSDDFARAHQILARGDIQINSNSSVQDRFEKAAVEIMRLPSLPNRDTMIKIYGLYKQATVGDVNIPKPKLTSDLKTKAKYKAWKKKKGVPKEEAMKEYIAIIEGLLGHPIGGVAAPSSSSSSSSGKSSTMSSNQVNSSSSANNHGVAAASPLSSASPSSSQEPSSPSSAALASSPSFEITQDDVNEVAAVEVNLVGHVDPEERLASISPAQSIDNIAANTDGNSSSAVASASPSSGLAISTPNSHASVTPLSPIQEQQQNQQARRGSSTISGDESIEALKRQIEALKAENGELKKTITELREPLETMRRLLD